MGIKLICREIECVEGVVRRMLEEEKINVGNVKIIVTDLPYNEISRFENGKVLVNSLKFRNFSNEVSGDSKLVSAYLIVVSLYAVVKDKEKVREIVSKFGEHSPERVIFDILFA